MTIFEQGPLYEKARAAMLDPNKFVILNQSLAPKGSLNPLNVFARHDSALLMLAHEKEQERLAREESGKAALRIVESYLGAIKRQASSSRIVAQIVGDESSIAITRFTRKGMAEVAVPTELHQALIDHRSHFMNELGHPWFRFEASVTGSVRIITSFTQEPTFEYTDDALMLDLIEFPRHLSETPEWFQKRMVAA